MIELEEPLEMEDTPEGTPAVPQTIAEILDSLADKDYLDHPRIRSALIAQGAQVIGPLVQALSSSNDHLRWEAAKALGEIGDPAAAPALVQALEDERFGVRWLASEALVHMGRAALPALLRGLAQRSDSLWLREGAHHVLRLLSDSGLHHLVKPVLAALDGVEPAVEVPLAAYRVLEEIEKPRT